MKTSKSSSLKSTDVVIAVDTREQVPWQFGELPTEPATLLAGDYSIKGLEHVIAIERKSLTDLVGCCGRERDRFERELQRLSGYQTSAVIVEASWDDVEAGSWRGKITPSHVLGSVCGWMSHCPWVFAGNPERAARLAFRIMFLAARRRYREMQSFRQICDDDMFQVATSKRGDR